MKTFQRLLLEEFVRRKKNNPAYSLRSMAKSAQVSPGQLSQILNGKKTITLRMSAKLGDLLRLSPKQSRQLWGDMHFSETQEHIKLSDDHFRMICDWHHYAILSLSAVRDNRADAKWIARRLGISPSLAKSAMERLIHLQLLEITEGKLTQKSPALETQPDIPSTAVKHFHTAMLDLAAKSLNEDPVENREFGSVTLAIHRKQMPAAKAMITEFRRKFETAIERTQNADEVYHLAVQFFPLTKRLANKGTHKQGSKK